MSLYVNTNEGRKTFSNKQQAWDFAGNTFMLKDEQSGEIAETKDDLKTGRTYNSIPRAKAAAVTVHTNEDKLTFDTVEELNKWNANDKYMLKSQTTGKVVSSTEPAQDNEEYVAIQKAKAAL